MSALNLAGKAERTALPALQLTAGHRRCRRDAGGCPGRSGRQRAGAGGPSRAPASQPASLRARARSTCHLQRPRRVQGAERVPGAQAGPLHHVVVRAAEEPVLPQRELVPGDELAAAGHAAETLDVVHLRAGAHHEVVLAEADAALGAFDPIQPAPARPGGREAQGQRSLQAATAPPETADYPATRP